MRRLDTPVTSAAMENLIRDGARSLPAPPMKRYPDDANEYQFRECVPNWTPEELTLP